MSRLTLDHNDPADPAAVFGAAMSLYLGIMDVTSANVGETYNGGDEFMRQCWRVADAFERWACIHVDFDEMGETWPYHLQEKFCEAYLKTYHWSELGEIILDEHHENIARGFPLPLRDAPLPATPAPEAPSAPPTVW